MYKRQIEVTPTRVRTRVVVGGPISNNKGINLPGAAVSLPALTEKDANDQMCIRDSLRTVPLFTVESLLPVRRPSRPLRGEVSQD